MRKTRTSQGWAGWLGAMSGKLRSENPEPADTWAARDWSEGWDDFMQLSPMEQRMENPTEYDRRMGRTA